MNDFCSQKGIKREFSNAMTPQQNGVAERRNKTLIEAVRTMLVDAKLPVTFWAEAVNTACYVQNRVLVNKSHNKTPYELYNGTNDTASQEEKKDVSSLRYIALPNWAHDALLEFSSSKPQDHCSTEVPEGSGNTNPIASTSNPPDDHMETLTAESPIPTVSSPVPTAYSTDSQDSSSERRLISKRVTNQEETPSLDNILTLSNQFEDILGATTNLDESNAVEADIIGPVDTPIQTRNKSKEEELLLFKIQRVWSLVDCPKGVRPIGTKWALKNKKDERGIVIRNKARLVAQGHTQEEGIDYDEMNVKSAFLYGTIDEEVYVMQPPRFQDPEYPAKVYKVEKAMYGLHQAPRAWY
nr:hypothetical protein [Tanacetum cinerariifolium]